MSLKTKKECHKLAPFVCPECKSTDCQIDHWDAPGSSISCCMFCGESRADCRKNSAAAHRKRCKRKAEHSSKCKS